MPKQCNRELFTDRRGNYRWRVKARNGRIIAASSEGFATASSAKRNFNSTLNAMNWTAWRAWRAG